MLNPYFLGFLRFRSSQLPPIPLPSEGRVTDSNSVPGGNHYFKNVFLPKPNDGLCQSCVGISHFFFASVIRRHINHQHRPISGRFSSSASS